MNSEYIITCKCGEIDEKARAGFSVLFPNRPVPQIIKHEDIHKFLSSLPRDWRFVSYVGDNLIKNKNKFAYYFLVSDKGNILAMYNLLKGKKVAV